MNQSTSTTDDLFVRCLKCGNRYDPENRLQVIRHEQGFCLTNPERRPYKKRGLYRKDLHDSCAPSVAAYRSRAIALCRAKADEWERDASDPRADLKNLIGVRGRARADAARELAAELETLQ